MKQSGFSLLEMLLALAIFSVSMLAALKLEIQSERQAQASQLQIAAVEKIDYAIACVRSSHKSLIPGWQKVVVQELPQGKASLIDKPEESLIKIDYLDPASKTKESLSYAVPKW